MPPKIKKSLKWGKLCNKGNCPGLVKLCRSKAGDLCTKLCTHLSPYNYGIPNYNMTDINNYELLHITSTQITLCRKILKHNLLRYCIYIALEHMGQFSADFQWPWVTSDPDFKVATFLKSNMTKREHLKNKVTIRKLYLTYGMVLCLVTDTHIYINTQTER